MNIIHNNSSNCEFQMKYRNLLRKIMNNNKYGNKTIEIIVYRNKIKKIKIILIQMLKLTIGKMKNLYCMLCQNIPFMTHLGNFGQKHAIKMNFID